MRLSVSIVAAVLLACTNEARADVPDDTIATNVVFYDSDYDAHWISAPDEVATWFVRRGFVEKNVAKLQEWLQAKVAANQAIGTSVVFAMGIAPSAIIYPPYDDCLLAHYLHAGGRVVWLSDVPMYVAQSDFGPPVVVGTLPQEQMLGLATDPKTFYGTDHPTMTPEGMTWGLEPVHALVRPVVNHGIATCFFADPQNEYCGVGLVNLRQDAPMSGFIFVPDAASPTQEALLRNAYRLATYAGSAVTIPEAINALDDSAPLTASLRFGSDDIRTTFLRGEIVPIYVGLKSLSSMPLEMSAVVSIKDESQTVAKWYSTIFAQEHDSIVFLGDFHIDDLRRGTYRVAVTMAPSITLNDDADPSTSIIPDIVTTTRDLRVAAPIDHSGTHVALMVNASPSARRTSQLLDWLAERDIEPQFNDDFAMGRDLALWHGMSFSVRRIGESSNAPAPPGYDSWRIAANGEIMAVHALGSRRVAKGFANPYRRQLEANDFGRQIAFDDKFPAFRRRAVTGDDYSQWFGIDYNRFVLEDFQARYGFAPPRPAALADSDDPGRVTPPPAGIIADDDPWLMLNRYWCQSVHGDTALRLSEAMRDNTQGEGLVGQISGGMQVPAMQIQSAQYPPYLAGEHGYSLISFYYYNRLWQPPIAHTWWLEAARMGHRSLEEWIVADSGYEGKESAAMYDHFGWNMLAGGAKGIQYFNYDSMTLGGIRAMSSFGTISREYGQLLAEMQSARKKVALLVPFEQIVYKPTSSFEMVYPFMDLVQAKVDVEPVSPDELNAETITHYEAVIIAQTNWLTQSTASLLADYVHSGGKVILDDPSGQALPIARTTRLNLRIGGTSIYDAGQVARINNVKREVETILSPPVDCEDPQITFRRFEADNTSYLYVNHQMTDAEFMTYRASGFDDDTLAEQMGYGVDTIQTVITRPNDGQIPFDILAHAALPVQLQNGKMYIPIEIPKWQGRIIAFLPALPDRIKVSAPPKTIAATDTWVTARVMGKGGNIQTLFPLHVLVTDPNGQSSVEYSQRVLGRNGSASFNIRFANNDIKGRWKIHVRDAMTGLATVTTIELQ